MSALRLASAGLATFAALAAAAPTAFAQAWSSAGAPVCTAPGRQYQVLAVSDGAGGVFVGWTDQRPGAAATDVYLARIGPDGAPAAGWPVDGIAICAAANAQLLGSMAPDGSGGVYLAWEDQRSDAMYDVFGQHVLSDGSLAPGWPADGLGIADYLGEQRDPELLPDGSGGVFCVWVDGRTYSFSQRDVYAQHLLGDGTPATGWAANGMRVTNASTYDYAPTLASDGSGGVYVTWNRGLTGGGQDVGAQHLGADGLPAASWPDTGVVLCGQPLDQGGTALASAPGGAALVVWKDQRNYTVTDTETDYYALRFGPDTTLAPGWPRDGAQVYATLNGTSAPFGASDGAGGLLFMWGELVGPTDENLYVMHVDSSGTVVVSTDFPAGVVSVCPDPAYQHPVALAGDGAGGALVAFSDYRQGIPNADAYVQRVTAGATIAAGWPTTGVALAAGPLVEAPSIPVVVPGGVIVAWTRGNADTADVYASLVGDDGVVPVRVSVVSSAASAAGVRVTWQVAGAADEWLIEKSAAAGEWREVARDRPDGSGRLTLADADVVAGARYGYRLAPAAGSAALGETWVEVPRGDVDFALRGVSPNPARGTVRVRFAIPDAGAATLSLVDLQGRRVREWSVTGTPGEREIALDGLDGLRAGLYWVRLRQGARSASCRLAIVD